MCICINCDFYLNCWVKKGLNKLPKVYRRKGIQITLKNQLKKKTDIIMNKVYLNVFLNQFTKKLDYEFDVIDCEGFCENPGQWLK